MNDDEYAATIAAMKLFVREFDRSLEGLPLSVKLATLRKRKRVSPEDVEKVTGLPARRLLAYESGATRPRKSTLAVLEVYYGMKLT